MKLSDYLPILQWGRQYNGQTFANDMIAAVIVTVMLIPQSLAYALLAGLPPQVGLYASVLPLVVYAIFGTSRTMAVGPVAILSLMTAVAAGKVAQQGTPEYLTAAIVLAVISGLMLVVMGIFRLGFLANFLSHPVMSGFVTATGILIAVSQLKYLLGIPVSGRGMIDTLTSIFRHLGEINWPTAAIGGPAVAFLFWSRKGLKPLLLGLGLKDSLASMLARSGPVLAVVLGGVAVVAFGLEAKGVRVVGEIPKGLPGLSLPHFDAGLWQALLGSSALIAMISFIESVSMAQTLAAKRRQRIDPDQELIALGAASLAAGVSGGYPVTGGFARSAVNFDAGAETPAAGAFTAVGIALAALFLTPLLYNLPQAVLAATVVVAVLGLVDIKALRGTWNYSKRDFAAMAATILVTLVAGVELGVTTGVVLSLLLHLYQTSRPHFAIVGQVPGTHHFRNVNRHAVVVPEHIVTIRIDESLYFANARFLQDMVYNVLSNRPDLKHIILMCPAVNHIDASGLESLEAINARLKDAGVTLHLSEVKGPVMDRLKRTHFLDELTGNVYLDQFDAIADLDFECAKSAIEKTGRLTEPGSDPCPSQEIAGVREMGG
ncbi:MAG: sulfate permease [Hyphomonas sp.]|nr:sulfate permease [Hyphomonas sp.]MCB9969872.1 sulfate permease [Hyphomonas sp.]